MVHGTGAVVSPNVDFVVGHPRSGRVVWLGLSVSITDPGMSCSPSHKRAIEETAAPIEDTLVLPNNSFQRTGTAAAAVPVR